MSAPAALPAVLAIDGGNSKTDLVLVGWDGTLLATARGGGFRPQSVGVPAAVAVLEELVARLPHPNGRTTGPVAAHVSAYLAGADLPVEERVLHDAVHALGWAPSTQVGNDTLALLRAGTSSDSAVAVVCGAGINCAGRGPDGRVARFPALGRLTGDWGGGLFLGEEVLWWGIRAEDGRGPATALAAAVTSHFGHPTVGDVAAAIHLGEVPVDRLQELTPLLFVAASAGDRVATDLVERLAEEVEAMGVEALRRLDLLDVRAEVVLGGGVLARRDPLLLASVERRYAARAPHAVLHVVDAPPVLGAALLGLDHLGVTGSAERRLRGQFTPTVQPI